LISSLIYEFDLSMSEHALVSY